MHVNPATGLLSAVRYLASPNCDQRPIHTGIDLLVLHGISLPPGEFGGPWIDGLFTNTLISNAHPYFAEIHTLRVSAHALIHRNGVITQYVPFQARAWHAGVSHFQGRARCNDFSIGIELEGTDEIAYSAAQYQALSSAITALQRVYPALTNERIVGHCDIAPERKTDPGPAFDWARLRQSLLTQA